MLENITPLKAGETLPSEAAPDRAENFSKLATATSKALEDEEVKKTQDTKYIAQLKRIKEWATTTATDLTTFSKATSTSPGRSQFIAIQSESILRHIVDGKSEVFVNTYIDKRKNLL